MSIAPEVLIKKGYTYTIDWWSLGVCAYELIFGKRPFRGKTNSDLTHAITRETLKFPEDASTKCSREGMFVLMGVSKLACDGWKSDLMVDTAAGARHNSAIRLQTQRRGVRGAKEAGLV